MVESIVKKVRRRSIINRASQSLSLKWIHKSIVSATLSYYSELYTITLHVCVFISFFKAEDISTSRVKLILNWVNVSDRWFFFLMPSTLISVRVTVRNEAV